MSLSDAIRKAIVAQGTSANQFHKKAKIARSTLFQLLADATDPDLSTLRKLREAGVKLPKNLLDAA